MSNNLSSHYIVSICGDGNFTIQGGANVRLYGNFVGRLPLSAIRDFESRTAPLVRALIEIEKEGADRNRGKPTLADATQFPLRFVVSGASEVLYYSNTSLSPGAMVATLIDEIEALVQTRGIRCPFFNSEGNDRDRSTWIEICEREDKLLGNMRGEKR